MPHYVNFKVFSNCRVTAKFHKWPPIRERPSGNVGNVLNSKL